jgi:hypothetical protein
MKLVARSVAVCSAVAISLVAFSAAAFTAGTTYTDARQGVVKEFIITDGMMVVDIDSTEFPGCATDSSPGTAHFPMNDANVAQREGFARILLAAQLAGRAVKIRAKDVDLGGGLGTRCGMDWVGIVP